MAVLGLGLALAAPAHAQVESREGIALQNQMLDLRRELDALRRGGAGAAPSAPSRGSAASGDLVQQLLGRVQELEEENRRLRGRLDVADNNDRQIRAEMEKLRGDLDFRLQALEKGAGRPAATTFQSRNKRINQPSSNSLNGIYKTLSTISVSQSVIILPNLRFNFCPNCTNSIYLITIHHLTIHDPSVRLIRFKCLA